MNEDRIQGVADGGPLRFGSVDDFNRRYDVGAWFYIQMADTQPARDDRNRAVLAAELVQACAPAWDDQIDVLMKLEQFADVAAVSGSDQLDRLTRQAAAFQRGADHLNHGDGTAQHISTT